MPCVRKGDEEMKKGYFGPYGGRFVPETLMPALLELEDAYLKSKKAPTS